LAVAHPRSGEDTRPGKAIKPCLRAGNRAFVPVAAIGQADGVVHASQQRIPTCLLAGDGMVRQSASVINTKN
jgi:hypothetical protein